MQKKPPSEWDDEMELNEVVELDDHELDVKIDDHELDFLLMPREEGEGFYEYMESLMDGINNLDVDHEVDKIIEELGPDEPYDDEDYYEDGEFPDEDR